MKVLWLKIKESIVSVLPITAIIVLLNFCTNPMPTLNFVAFVFGALFLVFGMSLYSLGSETAMSAIGSHIGNTLMTKKRNLPVILLVAFIIGFIVTIAEPDLMVLASQVENAIPKAVLLVTIAVGVGIFLLFSFLRIFLKVSLNTLLIIFYMILFSLAAFVNENFVPLAFDSGGVTTGPITVPFIMAIGIGISANLGGKNSQDNSFGMIALCSVGPILTVVMLGLLYNPEIPVDAVRPDALANYGNFGEVLLDVFSAWPHYMLEVGVALLPIVVFFLLFQLFTTRVTKIQLIRILIGIGYTYFGLSLFLTGANVGFMPVGAHLGKVLAASDIGWIIVPVGMIVGATIVLAEPAVQVLNTQVEEITSGLVKRKTMRLVLSISIAVSVGLSMVRILTGLSVWWIIVPGYCIALALSFYVPKVFTGIAFDSGGVASGPMTSTFLLPFALGACAAIGGNVLTDAFGVVALVAMTPLVSIEALGAVYKIKLYKSQQLSAGIKKQMEKEGDVIIDVDAFFAEYAAKHGKLRKGEAK